MEGEREEQMQEGNSARSEIDREKKKERKGGKVLAKKKKESEVQKDIRVFLL